VQAVSDIHDMGIVHLDIKPENVFIDEDFIPKVGDFGFSRKTHGESISAFCGSPGYSAPEIVMKEEYGLSYDGYKADLFSLGVLIFTLIFGCPPFNASLSTCQLFRKFS
jgi:serine/threonine protein kinase